jgi:hypothetical protein
MTTKYEEYLDKLMKAYEPYADFAGSEIEKIDTLSKRLAEMKDPEWISFREHPIAIRLYKHAANVYKASCMAMQNDDGSLSKEDRIKLHMSKLWAMWYIRSLGGDPKKIKNEVEKEIERFAESAGIKDLSTEKV